CTTLDFVDFDRIREAEPKWFMGFSDNTNFCFLLPTLCDTAAVYGPCAPAFGMEPWHPVLADALGLLTGEIDEVGTYGMWEIEGLKDEEHPLLPYNTTEETILVKYPEELEETEIYMSGRLLGGNMDLLTVLAGTCYDKVEDFQKRYPDDGIIWFLESCDLSVFDMRRALWHMEHCGWFKTTKGFIIGRPLHYGEEMMGMNQYNAVIEILKKYDVPIIMDADLGHLPPSMPMIVGAKAEVFCEGNDLRIRFIRE
ncbi:MAG: LD-carboxypeptidase, partial [Stomatobaculum sp.]|nr:LD-carboxypeptidase [Stomatobaculum sp.]